MASLLSPPSAPENSGRISQLLPSVKCSSCSAPVPIHELGEHVCAKQPAVPAAQPASSSSLSSFLPTRFQNLVSTPPRVDSPKIPAAPTRRSRAFSFGSKKVAASNPSPAPKSRPPVPPSPLSLAVKRQKEEEEAVRASPHKDSRDSSLSFASSFRGKTPAPSQQNLPPVPFPTHGSTLSVSTSRTRATSTASSSNSAGSRPSVDALRVRTPSNASQARPSVDSSRSRNLSTAESNGRPSYDSTSRARTPSDNSQFRPTLQSSPSTHSVLSAHSAHSDSNRSIPPVDNNQPPVPQLMPPQASAPPANLQPQPPFHQHHQHQPSFHAPEPDTKTGGEAGMAGVGRRGFQAAARAALFTGPTGFDGRRIHTPGLLDINTAINAANTPPLSPSHSSSHSPLSPFSQGSPLSAGVGGHFSAAMPSGTSGSFEGTVTPQNDPAIAPSRTPSPLRSPFSEGSISTPLPHVDDFDRHPSTPPKSTSPSLHDDYNNRPMSPSSDSEYGGLAYADSTDDEDDHQPIRPSKQKDDDDSHTNQIEFPSLSPRSKRSSGSEYSPRIPARSFSVATSISDYTTKTAAKSVGALDNAMETLFEDTPSSPTTSVGAPHLNHPFLASAPENVKRDSKPPKLPTRSHTSPTARMSRTEETKKPARSATSASIRGRSRVCASCDNAVEDGKWIPMDGGGVLCDKCWKNMYLPKCRRCNLPIEKQAVSSSDGQLKGKYHRNCFNCHSCHIPFPDKTFYVYDGKPFCEYHYHEANRSLCAAPTCGKPIEGPCAVSHSGDKYHPEHFVCQYARCTVPLDGEYWEMDGRMLCGEHMKIEEEAAVPRLGGDLMDDLMLDLNGEGDNFRNSLRAMRRVTRFIDIASLR